MQKKRVNAIFIFILAAFLGLLLTSCNSSSEQLFFNGIPGTHPVDPLFKEYYQDIGGDAILGPAITMAIENNGQTCQYFANAVACYNPNQIGANRFYLVSIGKQLDINEQAGYIPSTGQATLINGFEIYPDFLNLYNRLAELDAVGQPLSNPMYDYERGRVEQYFEKVGFVYQFGESNQSVSLLPYGAYSCDYHCRDYQYTPFSPNRKAPDMPFLIPYERLGGIQILGKPISDSYIAPDGNREQIFENVVIYAPPDNPNQIQFRPLPVMLGMIAVPPGEKKYGLEDNVVFYPSENGLGYHVPILFDQFIALHGSTEMSGNPIADLTRYREDNINRQCYQNYCLEYHQEAPESLRIRLTPLGIRYKDMLETRGQLPSANEDSQTMMQQPEAISPEPDTEMSLPNPAVEPVEQQDDLLQDLQAIEESLAAENQPQQAGAEKPYKTARRQPIPKGEAQPAQPVQPAQQQPTQPQPVSLPPQPENDPPTPMDPNSLVLLICEQKPQIPASGGQIIHLVVHKQENLEPVPGLVAEIKIVTPNGEHVYTTPPTGSGGRASIAIDPMPDLENGSLITYQVCVKTGLDQPLCEYDSYLIWNYQ